MNKTNLDAIFSGYIRKFESFNGVRDPNETYKWVAAKQFQDHFDIDAQDFAEMLARATKEAAHIFNTAGSLPLQGLHKLAALDPEATRELLRQLFQPDNGPEERIVRVDRFVADANRLVEKYLSGFIYRQNTPTTLGYLALWRPDENYFYKYSEVRDFADCVGFYDDFGTSTNFKLDVYHRFCNELVDYIQKNSELLKTHRSRFEQVADTMYPDPALHILAYDIIFSAYHYGLFPEGYQHPDSKARNLYLERQKKARQLAEDLEAFRMKKQALDDIRAFAAARVVPGLGISSKAGKKGQVSAVDNYVVIVLFAGDEKPMRFQLLEGAAKEFISYDDPELMAQILTGGELIRQSDSIEKGLNRAVEALKPYREFLD